MRRFALVMTASVLFSTFAGAAPNNLTGCNVLIICIDALRADHLGCYGYSRDTSPFIDTLAKQGIVFEQAVSNSSYTRESVASFFSGVLPSANPRGTGWFANPCPDTTNLPALFTKAGYATGFFTDHPTFCIVPEFDQGFTEVGRLEEAWGRSGNGPRVTARALDFARAHKGKPWLMYVHYLDPHSPYQPTDEAYLRFADSVYPNPLRLYDQVRAVLPELVKTGFGPGDPRFEDLVTRYDAEISMTDDTIETLFKGLGEFGALDNTLVIITADHGEEFLEHGFVEHAWRLYQESIHVPQIWWAPGKLEPGRIASRVTSLDVFPTLVALTGIPCSRGDFMGSALFRKEGGRIEFTPREKPIISELLIETRNQLRIAIDGDKKYMAASRWLSPADCAHAGANEKPEIEKIRKGEAPLPDIWAAPVHEECYDLNADPGERKDLLHDAPPTLAQLRAELKAFEQACANVERGSEALAGLTEEQMEQMENLGYLGGDEGDK